METVEAEAEEVEAEEVEAEGADGSATLAMRTVMEDSIAGGKGVISSAEVHTISVVGQIGTASMMVQVEVI